MASWLKKAKKSYISYKAKAPEREKAKRTMEMKKLRTKTAFAEQRAKLAENQARMEAAKTRISKSKSARPSVFGGKPGVSGGGFTFKQAPATDMWGSPIRATTPKRTVKRRKNKRK